jgi:Glyoxalase-like domain
MRLRQIVFAAQSLSGGRAALAQLLSLRAPYRDPGVAEFGIDNAVFNFGDQFIEVIAPTLPDTACGRHLARHGDSGYMLILQTDNFAREQAHWTALGVRTIWTTARTEITAAHLHPKDVGGAIVSVDEPRPAESWLWGGRDWRVLPGLAGRQRVRGFTLRAADPEALARRWALVLRLPEPTPTADGWRLRLDDATIDLVHGAPGRDGIAGFRLAVAEPEAVLSAARAAGLPHSAQHVDVLGTRLEIEAL